ncbi:AAA family ATPase [bacterium]|nr:AAA family ATPase [bacterium]
MADRRSVLVIGQAQSFEDMKLHLQKAADIELHHVESSAADEMKKAHMDIMIVESGGDHEQTCALLESLSAAHPDSILLLLSPKKPDPDKLIQYMNFGVRDILTNDDSPEAILQKAIGLINRRAAAGQAGDARIGKIACFFSAKGGVGKTFLAVTAGRWISRSPGARTILVDLDLQFGDMDLYVGANSIQTLEDLAEEIRNNSGRISDFIIDTHVHQVSPSLHLLSAPLAPEKAETIDAETILKLLKALKKRYDFVLVDTSAVLGDLTLSVFDKADRVFLVVDDEVPAIKNAGQTHQLLKKMNYPENKVEFVINGYSSQFSVDEETLMKVLTRKPYARIPASPAVRESINQGFDLVEKNPGDPAAQGIFQFAQKLAAEAGIQLSTGKPAGSTSSGGLWAKTRKLFAGK